MASAHVPFEGIVKEIEESCLYSSLQVCEISKEVDNELHKRFMLTFFIKRVWNQYENGRGTAFLDYTVGICYQLTDKLNISVQSGVLYSQQALLIPFRLGIVF